MDLHFGESLAKKEGLYMDFEHMKREYQGMEHWNPNRKILGQFESGLDEAKV